MTSLFGLFGHGIMLMALLLMVFQVRRCNHYWPFAYLLAAIVIILPLKNWRVIEFSWGYFSDLSMATIFVCLLYLLKCTRAEPVRIDHSLKLTVLILAMILFPSALGATDYDVFSLGFPSESGFNYFLISIGIIGLLAWFNHLKHLSIYIAMALTAYALNCYESQNFWVYLLDPIAVLIFVIGYLITFIKLFYSMLKNRLLNHV